MIYRRRWGDLPLWGEVIYYIFGSELLKIDKDIKYFHGSHECYIKYNAIFPVNGDVRVFPGVSLN
jgi:hypothetical protein